MLVITKYFTKKFIINLLASNILITSLFSLVEFFEKIVRFKHSTVEAAINFVALNFIPCFLENLPLSSFVATLLLLKEIYQQNEWEIFHILNIKFKTIFQIIFFTSSIIATLNFFSKEVLIIKISQMAKNFKQEQFKQNNNRKFFNQWINLENKILCHFNYLDMGKNQGQDITILNFSESFELGKTILATDFEINKKEKTVFIPKAKVINSQKNLIKNIKNKTFHMPHLFAQLSSKDTIQSLSDLARLIFIENKFISKNSYHKLMYDFFERILRHLLIIIYPLLTLILFFLFPHARIYKFAIALTPYPISISLTTIFNSLFQILPIGILSIIPYVILIVITRITFSYVKN